MKPNQNKTNLMSKINKTKLHKLINRLFVDSQNEFSCQLSSNRCRHSAIQKTEAEKVHIKFPRNLPDFHDFKQTF